MPEYQVKIQSLGISDNGKDVLLAADAAVGEQIRLMFSASDLDRLLAAVAHAASLAMQRRLEDASIRKLLPVEEWQVRPHGQSGVIITLNLVEHLQLSFALDAGAAEKLREAIFQSSTAPNPRLSSQPMLN